MKTPEFDQEGVDRETFAPFILRNALNTEWKDVRLEFSDWTWLMETYGEDIDDDYDYYFNGYGVEGLVKAVLFANGIDPETPGIDYNSEADTCYIHFADMNLVTRAAELAAAMIKDPTKLRDAAEISTEHEFDDG